MILGIRKLKLIKLGKCIDLFYNVNISFGYLYNIIIYIYIQQIVHI